MNRFLDWRWTVALLVIAAPLLLPQSTVSAQQQRQNALLLESKGSNAEAVEAWASILKSHPQDPEPMAHLGLLYARQQRYKEAR